MNQKIIINLEDNNYDFGFNIKLLSNKIAKETFVTEKFDLDTSFELTIVSKNKIKSINKKERNIDKVTDVLSFPNIDFRKPSNIKEIVSNGVIDVSAIDLNTNTVYLGSVVICYDKVLIQAKKYGHIVRREFSFLLVHSLLHLLGYDHMNIKDEKKMFSKQDKILGSLNIIS